MNEKLPKPMLDALAREAAPAEHPSADVLAAFVEQALAEGEVQSVADHLARCGDCREVVFLASNAAEESAAEEEDLMAADRAPQRQWVADYYDPAMAAAAKPASPQRPRRRWMPRLLWAAPIAAVLLVAAGYVTLERRAYRATAPELAANMSREPVAQPPRPQEEVTAAQPRPEVAAPVASAKLQHKAPPAKSAATKAASDGKVPPEMYDAMARSAAPPAPAAASAPPEKTNTEAAKATPESVAVTIGGAVRTAPAAPKANGFAPSAKEALGQYSAGDSIGLSMSRALTATHLGWRVTVQGHLEHVTPDGWVRVLADQTSAFRVVSVVGSDVWAGGNGGALFHSNDGGQHWNKVSLATAQGVETAAIVSVRFDDPQHGVVVTNSGVEYATSDGGVTWTKL